MFNGVFGQNASHKARELMLQAEDLCRDTSFLSEQNRQQLLQLTALKALLESIEREVHELRLQKLETETELAAALARNEKLERENAKLRRTCARERVNAELLSGLAALFASSSREKPRPRGEEFSSIRTGNSFSGLDLQPLPPWQSPRQGRSGGGVSNLFVLMPPSAAGSPTPLLLRTCAPLPSFRARVGSVSVLSSLLRDYTATSRSSAPVEDENDISVDAAAATEDQLGVYPRSVCLELPSSSVDASAEVKTPNGHATGEVASFVTTGVNATAAEDDAAASQETGANDEAPAFIDSAELSPEQDEQASRTETIAVSVVTTYPVSEDSFASPTGSAGASPLPLPADDEVPRPSATASVPSPAETTAEETSVNVAVRFDQPLAVTALSPVQVDSLPSCSENPFSKETTHAVDEIEGTPPTAGMTPKSPEAFALPAGPEGRHRTLQDINISDTYTTPTLSTTTAKQDAEAAAVEAAFYMEYGAGPVDSPVSTAARIPARAASVTSLLQAVSVNSSALSSAADEAVDSTSSPSRALSDRRDNIRDAQTGTEASDDVDSISVGIGLDDGDQDHRETSDTAGRDDISSDLENTPPRATVQRGVAQRSEARRDITNRQAGGTARRGVEGNGGAGRANNGRPGISGKDIIAPLGRSRGGLLAPTSSFMAKVSTAAKQASSSRYGRRGKEGAQARKAFMRF